MDDHKTAIVTASYGPDFERCKILCESVDRHLTGYTTHYILVDDADAPLFSHLCGPKRRIVTDKTLLPRWLVRVPGWALLRKRTTWLSLRTVPMDGWHMQQLRRIAIAKTAPEDAFFYCDSDSVFTKRYDLGALWQGGRLRLFREDDAVDTAQSDHISWLDHASQCFGEPRILTERHNYVRSFIAWRGDVVRAMCAHMEKVHGSHWIAVIGRSRRFSECMLYGCYADTFGDPDKHWHDDRDFCRMHWLNPPPTRDELAAFVGAMRPYEIGFGVQSFVDLPNAWIRELALGA